MFQKLECVCIYTADMAASLAFYTGLGLTQSWRIERNEGTDKACSLVGLRFPSANSSELVLSDNADVALTEIEIMVDDVRASFETLRLIPGVTWIREPFATESGHVAVMEAPDTNVFVLVGK
jgi:catechol 2,3-dioxygenase-like lactoylglutathione lyase family enzyme